MTSNSQSPPAPSMQHPSPPVRADPITYRLDGLLVYVAPAETYDEAVERACAVYPDALKGVSRARIRFSVAVYVQGKLESVVISPSAWPSMMTALARFEIVDVLVQPQAADEPPMYQEPPKSEPEAARRPRSFRFWRRRVCM